MAAFGALLEEMYDPQAAIIAVASNVRDQNGQTANQRAAHNRGRYTGPKYLPAGQKCKFGTCNIEHTDEYCWRSAEFTGKMPFNLYKKQRALYDEIEEDRKKPPTSARSSTACRAGASTPRTSWASSRGASPSPSRRSPHTPSARSSTSGSTPPMGSRTTAP